MEKDLSSLKILNIIICLLLLTVFVVFTRPKNVDASTSDEYPSIRLGYEFKQLEFLVDVYQEESNKITYNLDYYLEEKKDTIAFFAKAFGYNYNDVIKDLQNRNEKEEEIGSEDLRELERVVLLKVVDEKWMDHIDNILEIISKYDKKYTFTNNLYISEINKIERNMVVGEQLIKFAKSKVIVTDRLHGLIFALITNTPCIVISSYNQKLKEFTDMLKDNKSIIFIDKDISKLEKNLEALYNLEDNTIKNDFSKELNKVADIIKGFNEK